MIRSLHRLLRLFLPPAFREKHGAAMEAVFAEEHAAAGRRGGGAVVRLWIREALDMVVTGYRQRSEARRFGAEFVARGIARHRVGKGGGVTMGVVDDVRHAMRSLVRRPSLTVFAVVTVGLGVGATTAIFSTVEAVILHPLPYEGADRMVNLLRKIGNADAYVTPAPEQIEAWARMGDVFERVEVWSMRGMTLTGRGEAREVMAGLIRPSFHDLVGRYPVVGRTFNPEELAGDGAKVVLISSGLWEAAFGRDPGVLGESLRLDGEPYTVVGVMPPRTLMPGFGLMPAELWRPLSEEAARADPFATGIVREGVTLEAVNARLAVPSSPSEAEGPGADWSGAARLVAADVSNGVRGILALLMGAVVMLLLIACVNVSNLLLFRANARRRETAVRAALGSGTGRLVRQLLLESSFLALVGGALGTGLAYVGQDVILKLRPERLAVLDYVGINGRVLGFTLALSLITGFIFGLAPALHASRPDALEPLRSGSRTEGDVVGRRARWVLLVGEVGLSFALLMGSLSVLGEFASRLRADVGYRSGEVAVMQISLPRWRYDGPEGRRAVADALRDRMVKLPGVVHVSLSSGVPPRAGVMFGEVYPEGGEPLDGTQILRGSSVDAEYFSTLGQRILAGRAFTEEDVEAEESRVVVGESTAHRFFGDGDPIGRRFRVGADPGRWYTVIGVAQDVAIAGLSAATQSLQVYHLRRTAFADVTVLARVMTGADPGDLLPLMRQIAVDIDPELRIDRLVTADEMMRATLDRERFTTTIIGTFAVLALVLAAIGLYGVVSQVVGQRTREIGIRVALGAGRATIASMVLRRAGGATGAGVVLGTVLAVVGSRYLHSRVVGFDTTNLTTYLLASSVLALAALLAAYAPARRASHVDPVEAMRAE